MSSHTCDCGVWEVCREDSVKRLKINRPIGRCALLDQGHIIKEERVQLDSLTDEQTVYQHLWSFGMV